MAQQGSASSRSTVTVEHQSAEQQLNPTHEHTEAFKIGVLPFWVKEEKLGNIYIWHNGFSILNAKVYQSLLHGVRVFYLKSCMTSRDVFLISAECTFIHNSISYQLVQNLLQQAGLPK